MDDDTTARTTPKSKHLNPNILLSKMNSRIILRQPEKMKFLKRKEIQSDQAKKLLVIADSLCRMTVAVQNDTCDLVKGVHETYRHNIEVMYQQLLSSSGLPPINPPEGSTFDDTIHMAVGLGYGSRYPENTIHSLIRPGYTRNNSLIRPAEVIISKHSRIDPCIKKIGIIQGFLQKFSSPGVTTEYVSRQIDQLEHVRSEDTQRVEPEIQSLQETIVHYGEEWKDLEDMISNQAETIENLETELDQIKRALSQTTESTQNIVSLLHVLNDRLQTIEDTMNVKKSDDIMYSNEEIL